MRYRFLSFILLISLSACTFQTEIITPVVSVPTSTPPAFPVFTSTPFSELNTSTPAPFSTAIFPPTLIASPLPIDTTGKTPIHFPPNGTYIDVVDTVLYGTSKTYSVAASKGQVMSVSINQSRVGDWAYIPMQIVGADGTMLCPLKENMECEFWRGVLPSTQEYFITLAPATDALNFTLRIVIPPLTTNHQAFLYEDNRSILAYTDEFAPVRFPGIQIYKVEPEIMLEVIDSQLYTNTNLLEAYLLFGSTNESSIVAGCTQPASLGGPENIVGEVNIHGKTFVRSEGAGVGAGNIYEQIYHRAVLNGICYEVTFFYHYANIGNYAPDAGIKEFDHTMLLQDFESVLATLVIK